MVREISTDDTQPSKRPGNEDLESLAVLRGGAKQAAFATDVAPKLIILAGLSCGNLIFNDLFEDTRDGPKLKLNTLKEVISDYAERIMTPVFIGVRTGYLHADSERVAEMGCGAEQKSRAYHACSSGRTIDGAITVKLLRVRIRGWTATFRLPLLYTGTGLTAPVPAYSTLLGLIGSVAGREIQPTETRIGYEFRSEGLALDLERTQRLMMNIKTRQLRPQPERGIAKRQFHVRPQLDLYLDNLAFRLSLNRRKTPPALGARRMSGGSPPWTSGCRACRGRHCPGNVNSVSRTQRWWDHPAPAGILQQRGLRLHASHWEARDVSSHQT